MNSMMSLAGIVRSDGDPEVMETGPTSLTTADRITRALGWFSLALGAVELAAPGALARTLGLEGKERLLRAYGAREIMAGIPTLSLDKRVGLASRLAGDMIDIATLLPALGRGNPKRGNALLALAAVGAVTVLDCVALSGTANDRRRGRARDYRDRSGLPRGVSASRGIARQAPA
ncbi:MAG: hypothetical protein ACOY4R_12060 [Pseudomonadota bacterium]